MRSKLSSTSRPLKRHDAKSPLFTDGILVKKVLVESLVDGDIEMFKDVLIAHLRAKPNTRRKIEKVLGVDYFDSAVNSETDFDPTLSALASILRSIDG